MRDLSVILWLVFWPFSEVLGRPGEVEQDIGWLKALKLLGIAAWVCVVAAIVSLLI